jgi:hypothetical protein
MSLVTSEVIVGESQTPFKASGFSEANKIQFDALMANNSQSTPSIGNDLQKIVKNVETSFQEKRLDIVKSIEKFEESGGALDLMVATHAGANNSVMVQMCGTVGKKMADNTEQIYKQQ